jgi:hypothetical protein
MRWLTGLSIACSCSALLSAGDLPQDIQAKFIRIIARQPGLNGQVACADADMAKAIAAAGSAVEAGAKLVYAGSEAEVKSARAAGKLVVCGRTEWLPAGAGIALVEENGKPSIYLHLGNIGASGVTLTDVILKLGKRSNLEAHSHEKSPRFHPSRSGRTWSQSPDSRPGLSR